MFACTELLDMQDKIIQEAQEKWQIAQNTTTALADNLNVSDGYYDSIGERHSYNNLQKISIKHFKYNELYPV